MNGKPLAQETAVAPALDPRGAPEARGPMDAGHASARKSTASLPAGSIVQLGDSGSYDVVRPLATGGMAQVFLARRKGAEGFERAVAIKRIHAQFEGREEFERMFIQEARLASQLHHPNIAQVYDFVKHGDAFILVMEYIPGTTLRSALEAASDSRRAFSPAFACYLCAKLADALHYAHTARGDDGTPLGIVHRDVSPKNIMLDRHGEVKLLDFGVAISRLADRDKTSAGIIKGTWNYLSPEQAIGTDEIDGRADVFALALVFAELVSGRPVFEGGDADVLVKITQGDARSVARAVEALPFPLQPILRRALAHDRRARHATAGAFANDVRAYMHRAGVAYDAPDAAAELSAILLGRETHRPSLVTAPCGDERAAAATRSAAPRLASVPEGVDVWHEVALESDVAPPPRRLPGMRFPGKRWVVPFLVLAACGVGAAALHVAWRLASPVTASRQDRAPEPSPVAPAPRGAAPEHVEPTSNLSPAPGPVAAGRGGSTAEPASAQEPAPAPPPVPAPELVRAPEPAPAPRATASPPIPVKAIPNGRGSLLLRAGKLLANGSSAAALELYGRVISEDPQNAQALAGRGLCYLDLEQYPPAEASFLAALRREPWQPDALLGLAETYRVQGKSAEASDAYRKYLERYPETSNAEVARNALAELTR